MNCGQSGLVMGCGSCLHLLRAYFTVIYGHILLVYEASSHMCLVYTDDVTYILCKELAVTYILCIQLRSHITHLSLATWKFEKLLF